MPHSTPPTADQGVVAGQSPRRSLTVHCFVENILSDLRNAGRLQTRGGADGGYSLTRAPSEISVAEVLRAVEGPLAAVQGTRPEDLHYRGAAARLPEVWVALRANLRAV